MTAGKRCSGLAARVASGEFRPKLARGAACMVFVTLLQVQAQTSQQDVVIDSWRPLYEVTLLLEEKYGIPVTLEEPIWTGDPNGVPPHEQGRRPVFQLEGGVRFVVPGSLLPEDRTAFSLATLNEILALYNGARIDPIRFEAVSSEWGFHVVPVSYAADDGRVVPVRSALDFPVQVETARRLASEHFSILCKQLEAATGMRILNWVGGRLDGWFAAGGLNPPKVLPTLDEESREPYKFAWGVARTSARSALLDFLKLSATTLGWTVFCRERPGPGGQCVFGLYPLKVRVTDEQGRPVLDEQGQPRVQYRFRDRLGKIPLKAKPITIQ